MAKFDNKLILNSSDSELRIAVGMLFDEQIKLKQKLNKELTHLAAHIHRLDELNELDDCALKATISPDEVEQHLDKVDAQEIIGLYKDHLINDQGKLTPRARGVLQRGSDMFKQMTEDMEGDGFLKGKIR